MLYNVSFFTGLALYGLHSTFQERLWHIKAQFDLNKASWNITGKCQTGSIAIAGCWFQVRGTCSAWPTSTLFKMCIIVVDRLHNLDTPSYAFSPWPTLLPLSPSVSRFMLKLTFNLILGGYMMWEGFTCFAAIFLYFVDVIILETVVLLHSNSRRQRFRKYNFKSDSIFHRLI